MNEFSPPNAKTSNLLETSRRWNQYELPEDLTGKTFLDVGCWAGGFCVEALRRGAKKTMGIDMVKSDLVSHLQKIQPFNFLLCDIFSEKFLEIPSFDIVLCAGVLYHVESPISLLFRLKMKVLEKIIIETEIVEDDRFHDIPILRFFPENSLDDNYSN